MNKIVAVIEYKDDLLVFCENGDIYIASMSLSPAPKVFKFLLLQQWRPEQ